MSPCYWTWWRSLPRKQGIIDQKVGQCGPAMSCASFGAMVLTLGSHAPSFIHDMYTIIEVLCLESLLPGVILLTHNLKCRLGHNAALRNIWMLGSFQCGLSMSVKNVQIFQCCAMVLKFNRINTHSQILLEGLVRKQEQIRRWVMHFLGVKD